ncbi:MULTISPECIES: hypothetical protein [Olleya]|uniref:Uncharacterized protein n=1 Tax=Olleya namhaensis TaxID=1144750 RepID=A0A1I3M8L7_9FLAO|nr:MULTISPECIES: hypothetical protein [Olleya]PKG52854.1 hypothetical protein CXF54_03505 [Olleya sp. 1-3]SFI93036.1 hypothetical protein SAMN05443431_10343 [Olleya namhaensis]
MTKLQVEYIRLAIATLVFIFIITLLFVLINQVQMDWFINTAQAITIPVLVLIVAVPIWMIVDLIRKQVADKSIFNLTFFISVISILLMLFAIKILN